MSIVVRLELGSSTAAVPLKALPSGSSLPSVFLFSNLSLLSKTNFLLISSLARDLPYLAATTGRAAAQPFAGDERILQVCRADPFSFLVLVLCETEHPKP